MLLVAYDPEAAWKREDDGKNHGEIDAAIAVTQMMLQAADLGLGTTYVGMFDPEKLHAAFPELAGLTPIPPACTRTASPWRSWCGICDNKGTGIRNQGRTPRAPEFYSGFSGKSEEQSGRIPYLNSCALCLSL